MEEDEGFVFCFPSMIVGIARAECLHFRYALFVILIVASWWFYELTLLLVGGVDMGYGMAKWR